MFRLLYPLLDILPIEGISTNLQVLFFLDLK